MSLFTMCEWEYNGRDDSDWYAVVYDDEKDSLYRIETGTTRFAEALHIGPPRQKPTDEIMERAKAALQKMTVPFLISREKQRVEEPYQSLVKGAKVRLSSTARIAKKETTICQKCNGSGHWVNPKNENDKRTCFACNGAGFKTGKAQKNANGKNDWTFLEEGLIGEVLDTQVWGTFYRNGYNRPDRSNTRVLVKFETGETHWVGANRLRLDEEPRSEEELIRSWKINGGDTDFYPHWRTAGLSML
jgi:hypothetical protein